MMLKVLHIFILCLLLCSGIEAQNLVLNGSFEEGSSHWSSWQPAGAPKGILFEVSSNYGIYGASAPPQGRNFAEVDYESNFSQQIPVVKGTKYILRFAITRRADCGGDRTFKVFANGKEIFSKVVNTLTFSKAFEYQHAGIVAASDMLTLGFCIQGKSGLGPTYGVLLDDVSLTEAKPAAPEEPELKPGEKFVLKKVLFERSKAVLLDSSKKELNKLVDLMKLHPGMTIRLIGHTDNGGSPAKNLQLSIDRVKEVKKYLVQMGIDGNRIEYEGRGQKEPIADNDDPDKKYLNRRVEVEIIKFPR